MFFSKNSTEKKNEAKREVRELTSSTYSTVGFTTGGSSPLKNAGLSTVLLRIYLLYAPPKSH
jgi:hypothetical protein